VRSESCRRRRGEGRFGDVFECRSVKCGAGLARALSLNSLCYVLGGAANKFA